MTKKERKELDRIEWGFCTGESNVEQRKRLGIKTKAGFTSRYTSLRKKRVLEEYRKHD